MFNDALRVRYEAYRAGERMSDQDGRSLLPVQNTLSGGYGLGQRRQRILHGGDVEPRNLQTRNHFDPAGCVGKKTVYQHYILRFDRRGHTGQRERGQNDRGANA